MHEGVGGSGRSGGGLEGGPVPRTSLAHSGGRRWEGGRPGLSPAPGLAQQSSSCGCSRAAAALWPGPRLVPGAEGRGAGGAARPALSGSRPRGGASSARAPQLLGACRRTRSPSSHRSAAAGCFAACGMLSGLARPAFLSEDPAAASLQAASKERAWGREVGAGRRAPSDRAHARRSPCERRSGWGPRADGNGRAAAPCAKASSSEARQGPSLPAATPPRGTTTDPSCSPRCHRARTPGARALWRPPCASPLRMRQRSAGPPVLV